MYNQSSIRLPKAYACLDDEELDVDGGKLKWWAIGLIVVACAAGLCLIGGGIAAAAVGIGAKAGFAWAATATAVKVGAIGAKMAAISGTVAGITMGGGMFAGNFTSYETNPEKPKNPWDY